MRAMVTRLAVEVCPTLQPRLRSAGLVLLAVIVAAAACMPVMAQSQAFCGTNSLPNGNPTNPPDLIVIGDCHVKSLPSPNYYFGNVNIVVTSTGKVGRLIFDEPEVGGTNFWAKSILVQNGASLLAGTDGTTVTPIVNTVTIHLWGADQLQAKTNPAPNKGIHCVKVNDSDPLHPKVDSDEFCGVDPTVWSQNKHDGSACTASTMPDKKTSDCFYSYMPIEYDTGDPFGYFGSKVLAVSYGGTLQLFGRRGVAPQDPKSIADSGTSWARLNASVAPNGKTVILDRAVAWKTGDWIVVSSTDYLPGHAEQMQIDTVSTTNGVTTLSVHGQGGQQGMLPGFKYVHNGVPYPYRSKIDPSRQSTVGPEDDPNLPAAMSTSTWPSKKNSMDERG